MGGGTRSFGKRAGSRDQAAGKGLFFGHASHGIFARKGRWDFALQAKGGTGSGEMYAEVSCSDE